MRTKIKPKLAPHDMAQRLLLNEQRVDTIAAMTQTIEEYCEAVEELNRDAKEQLGFVAPVKGGDDERRPT